MKTLLVLVVAGFVVFCGVLIVESGFFDDVPAAGKGCMLLANTTGGENDKTNSSEEETQQLKVDNSITFGADNATAETVILGAVDPASEDPDIGFKLQLELSSRGAAISKATFSSGDGKGFDDRDYKNPQPLVILSPVGDVLSMANGEFIFTEQNVQLLLQNLHWKSLGVETGYDGSQKASFEAIIKVKQTGKSVIKLTKTFKIYPVSYLLECDLTVENLSASKQKVRFHLNGPVGVGREGFRSDMRMVTAGFRNSKGENTASKIAITKFDGKRRFDEKQQSKDSDSFLWTSIVNKYFAAIVIPVPDEGKNFCDWVKGKRARFYNPDGLKNSGDENIGISFKMADHTLAAAGQLGNVKQYKFKIYIGPKDKSFFDKNEYYKNLGFVQTIDFMGCFCPTAIISPLAFGILAAMEWLYSFIPNYGVVIIIIVFIIRLVIHPLTKKSQISMSKMSKLAPKMEEIKKKYANNKAEMQKQMMGLYREHGASPIMGMIPMFVQMPIWISLYSAIYASIALRGAAFLPFWITDLSSPDALIRFSTIVVPVVEWKISSFNLLPIIMGVAFYLQQKLMPKQASAATNPQIAQQQKMMMIMMPIMFPVMLYNAPSGLNLYIMASTFAGVIEQYIIRKHIREKEEVESKGLVAVTSKTGGKFKKKKPKPFYKQ